MKKILLILFTLVGVNFSYGQLCEASDDIKLLYQEDADQLAVRMMKSDSIKFIDSIIIPDILSSPIMNALLAVYNSELPERDTVVDIYNIHAFRLINLHRIEIVADSNLTWMNQLSKNNLTTGNATIDSIIKKYQFHVASYLPSNGRNYSAVLETSGNYNMSALIDHIDTIVGVSNVGLSNFAGDGNDLKVSIYNDYVELVFSYGWGDCPSGCISRHYWKFHVFNNCSVEFISSYGDKLLSTNIQTIENSYKIFPNPFEDNLNIYGLSNSCKISIYNNEGDILIIKDNGNNEALNLSCLAPGYYIVKIETENGTFTREVIKK